MKRSIALLLMCLMAVAGMRAQGWPANYGGVMLQGFYWDSYEDTQWNVLTAQADELSSYYDLIWIPNSGQTKADQWNAPGNWGYENMGYMPVYWLRHNTCFGTEEELINMIQTFKAKGTKFIEDVVINHKNGLTNWADFPSETVTGPTTGATYTVTWADNMQQLWGICANDEIYANGGEHDGTIYVSNGDARDDEADNFDGCRDLDHTDARVQDNIKTYLRYLLDELGYAGFRYDMVKGYKAYYTGLYNKAVKPEFSVGEYWDGNYDNVAGYWITETGLPADGVIQSAAFDFPLKDRINAAFNNEQWSALSNKGVAGDPNMSRYAVTFVDNHDTYREEGYRVNSNVLAANAFILAMPGTPCLFLPHWKQYKASLKKMIAARKAAGITNQSAITAQYELDGGYYLKVTGEKGSVIMTCGKPSGDIDLDQHTLVESGENFAFYLSDGVYDPDTYEAIEDESAKDICIYVRDNGQGAPYLYAWNGGNQLNGGWPGVQMSDKVTLSDGSTWYKQAFSTSLLNVIVTFNEGKQTQNIENITEDKYIVYYKDDDRKYADYSALYNGDYNSDYVYAYFDAPTGWDKVWAWNDRFYDVEDKNYTGGTWPGATMTKVGVSSTGNDIYRWRITKDLGEGVPNHVIFSGNEQTTTLPFINGAYYDQNGIASENRLWFYANALEGGSTVSATNWNGATEPVAYSTAEKPVILRLYYPAGTYTVQAIVRGTAGSDLTLTAGTSTTSVSLTGMEADSPSTVTTDGVVERSIDTGNGGWQKVQATFTTTEEQTVIIRLNSPAAQWQIGAVTLLKDADTESADKYQTTATTRVTETGADVTAMNCFSLYERGANKNALVVAAEGQEPAALPCNAIVGGQCSQLVLTDGAYDFAAPDDFTAASVSYDRTIAAGKKVTVCLPFAVSSTEMDEGGITAYVLDRVTPEGYFHFSRVAEMAANTPYIIELAAAGKPFASLAGRNVSVTPTEIVTDIDGIQMVGTMKREVLNSSDGAIYYGYQNGSFVKVGSNVGINPFRAYVKSSQQLGNAVQAQFDDTTVNGIRSVETPVASDKAIYRLDGRLVSRDGNTGRLGKGIYIQGGKKVTK